MDLDTRIKKLVTGMSARDAAEARTAPEQPSGSTEDKDRFAEFSATVEVMFLMAAVDGSIESDEITKLAEGIRHMASGAKLDETTLAAWLEELHDKLEQDGWSRRLSEAAAKLTTPAARARAFRLATAVAVVDDHVAHAEAAAFDAFSHALELEDDVVSRILREVQEELFGAG